MCTVDRRIPPWWTLWPCLRLLLDVQAISEGGMGDSKQQSMSSLYEGRIADLQMSIADHQISIAHLQKENDRHYEESQKRFDEMTGMYDHLTQANERTVAELDDKVQVLKLDNARLKGTLTCRHIIESVEEKLRQQFYKVWEVFQSVNSCLCPCVLSLLYFAVYSLVQHSHVSAPVLSAVHAEEWDTTKLQEAN